MIPSSTSSFEVVLAELAAGLLNVPDHGFDEAMTGALGTLVRYLEVDRSTLVQIEADGPHITHTYALPGVVEVPLGDIASQFPYGLGRIRAGRPFLVERLEDLPPEAATDAETLRSIGNRSVAVFPIMARDRALGAVAFGGIRRAREWPPQTVARMELVAAVLAGALLRSQRDAELQRALAEVRELKRKLEVENTALIEVVSGDDGFHDLVGGSEGLRRVVRQIQKVAAADATVLVTGETGTGKELVARAIHRASGREDRPFIKVDCGALPASIVESELFGHARGAFTGAVAQRTGRFELARGGTVFLDEVGELPLELQTRLLRVLEDGEFEPVGSTRTVRCEARVVAATNRDLERSVLEGRFRRDLFFRLSVFPVHVPPLRERREDIPLLVLYFVDMLARELGKPAPPVPAGALERLATYDWPGNVRELRNTVERAMILSDGSRISFPIRPFSDPDPGPEPAARPGTLRDVERRHVIRTLEWCGWKVRGPGGAAETLDINASTLRSRMKKLGIRRPSDRRARTSTEEQAPARA